MLVLPVALRLPGPVTAAADAGGDPSRAFELLAPCRAVSLFGVPAVSVPLGRSGGRAPVSVQVVAPVGGEALALAAAGVLEDAEVWS
jgi:amidase